MMKNILRYLFLLFFLTGSFTIIFAQRVEGPKPIFKNGEAQVVPEFSNSNEWIKEELWVETTFDSDEDGKLDRMHVFVTRPAQTNSGDLKLPVIYMSSPYYGAKLSLMMGGSKDKYMWNVKQELGEQPKSHKHPNHKTRKKRPFMAFIYDKTWVSRGYVMVYSSSPGTGLSDGAPTVGGENESLAPKAVIDWLCGRADGFTTRDGNEKITAHWSAKKVGMTGTSYDGTLCLAAATTGVEGLEAIIPVAPVASFYHYYRSNGLVRSPGGYLGEDIDVLYDFIHTGNKSKRKRNNKAIRDNILIANHDRVTGDYNDFWDSRNYLNQLDSMKTPMLMAHGFNDWNVMPEHSYLFYKAIKAKGISTQLYYHQGGHGGEPPMKMMNRWFTRYLHGVENGVENDSPVKIVREGDRKPTAYAAYPDTDASDVTFYLKNGGTKGKLVTQESENQATQTLVDDASIDGAVLVKDENATHRLLYVTPILKQSVRISGVPRVTVKLACNKPAANLSVWLVSLPWNEEKKATIYENIITRGWADPQNSSSLTDSEPLVPGAFYEVSFDLMPDDQVIPKGQQIGLLIFSTDNGFTLWPESGTELTIDPNGTSITLPIVDGIEVYQKATEE
ncbi:MAG: X-Pro dipeptidyl-peptidase [Saprospiraceae bacterium]|jgi:X-Pro dipeptidyl-peptidase